MATVNISAMAKTWNDAGTTFTAIKMDVTDTASNAASLLLDLQVGSSSKFSVNKSGTVTIPNSQSLAAGGQGKFGFVNSNIPAMQNALTDLRLNTDGSFGLGANFRVFADAAAVMALRNSTTAQTYRVYGTFTDASNYERLAVTRDAITVESAGTGTANIDLALTPAGTGVLKFGTHTAVGSETLSGYITIKDAGGTSRKVAVVS